jgi:3-oxoacyl-[acyl-carrier-protein] synthase-3
LGFKAQTLAQEETHMIRLGSSNLPGSDPGIRFIKMDGRKVYELALNRVPQAMRDCLDEAGIEIGQLKKIFIHQANDKMDEAIVKRFYRLYGMKEVPEWVVPMNIHELGNSSVATVPTLFHQVLKEQYKGYRLKDGDVIMFASIGAGMNINAIVYKM